MAHRAQIFPHTAHTLVARERILPDTVSIPADREQNLRYTVGIFPTSIRTFPDSVHTFPDSVYAFPDSVHTFAASVRDSADTTRISRDR